MPKTLAKNLGLVAILLVVLALFLIAMVGTFMPGPYNLLNSEWMRDAAPTIVLGTIAALLIPTAVMYFTNR